MIRATSSFATRSRIPDIGGPVGPYVQSERMGMFKQYAEQLVAEGKAYYCFCTDGWTICLM